MKRFLYSAIIVACMLTGLSALAQKPATALEMNNYLASITDSLYQGGKDWGKKLNTVVQSKRFDSLAPFRIKMEEFIARKQAEIKTMTDIGGSENLRKAMLTFLEFEAKMMKDAFQPLEKLTTTSTQTEIKKAIDDLIAMAATEGDNLKKVNEAQREYAAKNGFAIEDKDEK